MRFFMKGKVEISFLILLFFVNPSWGSMYKCTDSSGRISYQQKPCSNASESVARIEKKAAAKKNPGPVSARPFDFRKAQQEYNEGNTGKAIRDLKAAAQKGNINAQMTLANIYCHSPGGKVRVSNSEAVKWSKMACDKAGVTSSCDVYKRASKGQCKQVEDKRKKYRWWLK